LNEFFAYMFGNCKKLYQKKKKHKFSFLGPDFYYFNLERLALKEKLYLAHPMLKSSNYFKNNFRKNEKHLTVEYIKLTLWWWSNKMWKDSCLVCISSGYILFYFSWLLLVVGLMFFRCLFIFVLASVLCFYLCNCISYRW